MTRDQFIYALTACGCLLKDGKTWYEHNELIKCFEDLGLFEQEPQTFKWCTDCKEYDQEKHCCHRWSKVIRDTVEEMKQEPRWISVSERLPEESGMYLVSGRWKNEPYEVWICEFMYLGELKGWANDAKRPIVTAWMPLPKHREVESEQT